MNPMSKEHYQFQGDNFTQVLLLPRNITDISGSQTHDSIARSYVIFTSSKREEVETIMRTLPLLEFVSQMDWLLMVACLIVMHNFPSEAKYHHLFLVGARTIMII